MADVTPAGDRPALENQEIEVTPEMIRAGIGAFCAWDSRYEEAESLVVDVFEAMTREKQVRQRHPQSALMDAPLP